MSTRFAPAVFAMALLSGCSTPVTTVEQHAPDLSRTGYENFVAQRVVELQQMGGPFSDRSVAAAKADEEYKSRYGEVPPQYTATWGSAARAAKAQAKVKDTLEKMDRDATRQ